MTNDVKKLLLLLSKRAEKSNREALIESFVDVGPLFTILSTVDNQILYGRRGTGKTHALLYLAKSVNDQGDIPVYLDLRHIGSVGGIYNSNELSVSERATRLLCDVLAAVHDKFMDIILDDKSDLDFNSISHVVDDLGDAITDIEVKGPVSVEESVSRASNKSDSVAADFQLGGQDVSARIGHSSQQTLKESDAQKVTTTGDRIYRVHFGQVGNVIRRLTNAIGERRIWLLLDEWSVVPVELQPYLADLMRRAVFPSELITVKIGAIEKRTNFKIYNNDGDYIGIELGGDASADINMDDFMVFENDEDKAINFFRNLIYKHISTLAKQKEITIADNPYDFVHDIFTQENVFREYVRASEGIPRDAFSILSLAARQELESKITMEAIRKGSKSWYLRDKEQSVSSNQDSLRLLHWIIDEIIGSRRARAFLLIRGKSYKEIDHLYDDRVLHLLKRNISSKEEPGIRYDVYKIDYGCYVDLLTTTRSPQGLLPLEDGTFIEVPADDYRSIRRAILDMEEYYSSEANN